MKIRSGFVSNSSSSSYIIGLAKISENKLTDRKAHHILKVGLTRDGWLDLPEPLRYERLENGKYKIFIESFTGTKVVAEISIGDWIMWLDSYGPDGDNDFWNGYEYDYDVSLEDFLPYDQEIYKDILALGGEATYGAGRDG